MSILAQRIKVDQPSGSFDRELDAVRPGFCDGEAIEHVGHHCGKASALHLDPVCEWFGGDLHAGEKFVAIQLARRPELVSLAGATERTETRDIDVNTIVAR